MSPLIDSLRSAGARAEADGYRCVPRLGGFVKIVRCVAALTVSLCALLPLGGCGEGESGTDGTSAASGVSASASDSQGLDTPAALIGSWGDSSSEGFRTSVYTFNGDGSFSMNIKGVRITGRFSVSGNQLTTYSDGGAQPLTYQWSIGRNGYLYLDGESYAPFS